MENVSQAPTLTDALGAFLDEFKTRVSRGYRSAATLQMHRVHAELISAQVGERTTVAEITATVLESFAAREMEGRRGQALNPLTLRKRLSTLRQTLELARRRGWIARVPEFPVVEGRYKPRTAHLRNGHELREVLRALPLHRAEWVAVAVFTGQHPSDVNRMQAWNDADPSAEPPWMVVRNTKNRKPDGITVVMPEPLVEVLRERFERCELRPGDPLVVPWDKDSRCRTFRALRRKLGLMPITAMGLRHTAGTWIVDELGSITKAAQEFMGHSSPEMLSKVYAHALAPRFTEIAAALAKKAVEPPPPRRLTPKGGDVDGIGPAAGKKKGPVGASNTAGPESDPEARAHGRVRWF